MEVPDEFSIVEAGLFSARVIPERSFPFIRSLNLHTIVLLDPGAPSQPMMDLVESENINLVHLIPETWRSSHESSQQHQTWIAISECLKYSLDKRHYPLLLVSGGGLRPLIRKLQNWTLSAVLNDYNSFSESSGARIVPSVPTVLEQTELYYGRIEDAKAVMEEVTKVEPYVRVIIVDLPEEEENKPEWVLRYNIGRV